MQHCIWASRCLSAARDTNQKDTNQKDKDIETTLSPITIILWTSKDMTPEFRPSKQLCSWEIEYGGLDK